MHKIAYDMTIMQFGCLIRTLAVGYQDRLIAACCKQKIQDSSFTVTCKWQLHANFNSKILFQLPKLFSVANTCMIITESKINFICILVTDNFKFPFNLLKKFRSEFLTTLCG